MSAFLVSDAHICALVTAAAAWDTYSQVPSPNWAEIEAAHPGAASYPARRLGGLAGSLMPHENVAKAFPTELARALALANVASLRARYSKPDQQAEHDLDAAEAAAMTYAPNPLSPASILKQIDCYAYQCCEVSDWDSCWAKSFCDALRKCAINALPDYQSAPWGV